MKYMMILWLFMPNGAIIPGTYTHVDGRYDTYEECMEKSDKYKGVSFSDTFLNPKDGYTYKVAGMGAMCVKDTGPNEYTQPPEIYEDDYGQDPEIPEISDEPWDGSFE